MKLGRLGLSAAVLCLASGSVPGVAAPRAPRTKPRPTHQLLDVARWPEEPKAPAEVDPVSFAEVVAEACRTPAAAAHAEVVLAAAAAEGVDPFELAALMVDRSGCRPKHRARGGFGLLAIDPTLYVPTLYVPTLHVPTLCVPGGGSEICSVARADLAPQRLFDPAHNLGLGARLLRAWHEAHGSLDELWGGAPHRSGLAHFVWGDRVGSGGDEDLVLTTRRRLLAAYTHAEEAPSAGPEGLALLLPLAGAPRVATSQPGEDRDGGLRRHRGLDIVATEGEPVRAMADGTVIFAGVNLRGSPRRGPVAPERIGRYARSRRLGAGGVYLCVSHDVAVSAAAREVVSCYMHLSDYVVRKDEHVSAGQTIGFVGRTGVRTSPTHLHLELRVGDRAVNPLRYLSAGVIPPKDTFAHRYSLRARRLRLRASLRARPSEAPAPVTEPAAGASL